MKTIGLQWQWQLPLWLQPGMFIYMILNVLAKSYPDFFDDIRHLGAIVHEK